MEPDHFLQRRGGVARTADFRRAGFSRTQLSAAVRNGRLFRPLRGVYATGEAEGDVLAAYRENGRLTCISAARFHRLWVLHRADVLHLSCGNGAPRRGVVDHAACTFPGHPYLPVASLADVLLHALRCLPELESLVMVQSAVGRGDITAGFLERKLVGNRNGKARSVLGLLLPRADSLLEILAHTHFVRAGFRVRMHVVLEGVGEVDCLIDECLVVELDGATHFEPRQIKKDQRRNNASIVGGRLVLRYYYDDVVYSPEAMVAEIRAVLRQRELGTFAPS